MIWYIHTVQYSQRENDESTAIDQEVYTAHSSSAREGGPKSESASVIYLWAKKT